MSEEAAAEGECVAFLCLFLAILGAMALVLGDAFCVTFSLLELDVNDVSRSSCSLESFFVGEDFSLFVFVTCGVIGICCGGDEEEDAEEDEVEEEEEEATHDVVHA